MPDETAENAAPETRTVLRFDTAAVDPAMFERTPEGIVRTMGRAAKPGILRYSDNFGRTVRELVPRSVLADPDYLRSLENKPITIDHPPTLLDVATIAQYRKGMVLSPATFDGEYQLLPLQFDTQEALDALAAGKTQLSTGCKSDVADIPGVDPEFGEYDCIQTRRYAGNHTAICRMARAGGNDLSVLRFDSAGNQIDPLSPTEPPLILSDSMKQVLDALGLDSAKAADDAAALEMVKAMKPAAKTDEVSPEVAALQAKVVELAAAKAQAEADLAAKLEEHEVLADDMAPAALGALADEGPMMADAACSKMDSARRDWLAPRHAKAFDAFAAAALEFVPMFNMALESGVPRMDALKMGTNQLAGEVARRRLPAPVVAEAMKGGPRALRATVRAATRMDSADPATSRIQTQIEDAYRASNPQEPAFRLPNSCIMKVTK